MSIQKDVSDLQEKEVAKKLNGKLVSGSGCGNFDSGDVSTDKFLIECKTVTKDQTSFSIKEAWLHKIKEQAFEEGKEYCALAFRFSPKGKDYIVLDIDTFKMLVEEE